MQDNEESKEEVVRQFAGIAYILKGIADEASGTTRTEIDKARTILAHLAEESAEQRFRGPPQCTTTPDPGKSATPASFRATHVTTRQIPVTAFTNIEIDCAFIFEIVAADSHTVAVTASESLFDYISVVKSGDTLKLSLKPTRFLARPCFEARIGMPMLNRLRQGAATKGMVSGFRSQEPFDLYLSGASVLHMDMEAGDVRLEISGASSVSGDLRAHKIDFMLSGASHAHLAGLVGNLVLSAWGAAELDLIGLVADEATVYLKGASQATVNVKGRLDIDLTGASRLDYAGRPSLNEIGLSGASVLSQAPFLRS